MSEVAQFSVQPERRLLRGLRGEVRDTLTGWSVSERTVSRMLLVVDEMIGNSIDHGDAYRVTGHALVVRVRQGRGGLHLHYVDPDVPEELVEWLREHIASATQPPPLEAERGRGLFLINNSLDVISLEWSADVGMAITGFMRDATE